MPTQVSRAAHQGLAFASPLSERDVDEAIAGLVLPDRARVVETGCGAGELLVRVLESHPNATALGIDADEAWIDVAKRKAEDRGTASRAEIRCASVETADLPTAAFDLAINIAASQAHGGYAGAIRALSGLVPQGGRVLFGEGFWRKPPSRAFLEALGGASPDELTGLDNLVEEARHMGLVLEHSWVASPESWEEYETRLARNAEALQGPEARSYAEAIRRRRALPDGCDTLGFALLELRRGSAPLAGS